MRSASALSSMSIEVAPRWMMPPPTGHCLGVRSHLGHQVVVDLRLDGERAIKIDLAGVRPQVFDL